MRSVLILLCMLLLICPGFAKDSSAIAGEQISVLIVDGRNNHNWQITTAALRATLEATERFTVTPDSVSVVDGNICMEFTHTAFIRFSLRRPLTQIAMIPQPPFSPSAPLQRRLQGPPAKSNFLTAKPAPHHSGTGHTLDRFQKRDFRKKSRCLLVEL